MSNSSERLSKALQSLPFVEVIKHDQQGTAVNIMCRVKPANVSDWSKLAFDVLKASEEAEEAPWDAHIARAYLLRNGELKYAWNFIVVGRSPEEIHNIILETVIPLIRRRSAVRSVPSHSEKKSQTKQPVRRARPMEVPMADEQGNPIVPEEHKVETISMAGLPEDYDRNNPDDGKGAWSIEGRDNFRPPVRKR